MRWRLEIYFCPQHGMYLSSGKSTTSQYCMYIHVKGEGTSMANDIWYKPVLERVRKSLSSSSLGADSPDKQRRHPRLLTREIQEASPSYQPEASSMRWIAAKLALAVLRMKNSEGHTTTRIPDATSVHLAQLQMASPFAQMCQHQCYGLISSGKLGTAFSWALLYCRRVHQSQKHQNNSNLEAWKWELDIMRGNCTLSLSLHSLFFFLLYLFPSNLQFIFENFALLKKVESNRWRQYMPHQASSITLSQT